MGKSPAKEYIYNLVVEQEHKTLAEALASEKVNGKILIEGLLETQGFLHVRVEEKQSTIHFFAGFNPMNLHEEIVFHIETGQIEGNLAFNVAKIYEIVYAIENVLSHSLLYREMLFEKIDSLCEELNIQDNFYSLILHNWHN